MLNMLVWIQKQKQKVENIITHKGYVVQPNTLHPRRKPQKAISIIY